MGESLQLLPALQAAIFGLVAGLGIWAVDQKRLSKWTAWTAIVVAGMFFRISGQV